MKKLNLKKIKALKNHKKLVIIINGKPTAGKDQFIEFLNDAIALTGIVDEVIENFSSVDVVKQVAGILGWNGEKDDKSRNFLSDLKDLWSTYNDGPFRDMIQKIYTSERPIIFLHIREPDEIEKVYQYYLDNEHIDCLKLFIHRDIKVNASNHADNNVHKVEYNVEIDNTGTLVDLFDKANDFINHQKLYQYFTNAILISEK